MNKRIFISGPISGIKDFNFPKFNLWKKNLTSIGYEVVSPADMALEFGVPEIIQNNTDLLNELKKKEIEELEKCDSIFLLNGWNNSVGAKKELNVALSKNLEILEETSFLIGTVMFGGAFNPLTNAHMEIISNLHSISDKLIIAITDHDYKKIETDFDLRYEMVLREIQEKFFLDFLQGKILIVRQPMRTWNFLHSDNKMKKMKIDYLALGEDESNSLEAGEWQFSNKIKEKYKIFKINRPKHSISSTSVRKIIEEKGLHKNILNYIPKTTFKFIKENSLYRKS